jgi:hypothetical protein
LKNSRTAFDLRVIFESIPSNDYDIGGYAKHQNLLGNPEPLKQALINQRWFINEVVEYAELVIKKLNK